MIFCNYYKFVKIYKHLFLTMAFSLLLKTGAYADNAKIYLFQSFREMVKWEIREMNLGLTNGMEMDFKNGQALFLPTNFIYSISNEIAAPKINALIMRGRNNLSVNQTNEFAVALYMENSTALPSMTEAGFSIRSNCPIKSEECPFWMKRLKYYIASRFDGHTIDFITQAIEEEAGVTNAGLPFGFPRELKSRYWLPTKWIEEDSMTLDWIDHGIPRDPGIVPTNNLWLVRDGRFAWIYWVNSGLPLSQKRDALEYDPHFKTQFESATTEALKSLKKQNVYLDIGIPLDAEVQRLLKQRYNIEWVAPFELIAN